jgi:hypothetical protein
LKKGRSVAHAAQTAEAAFADDPDGQRLAAVHVVVERMFGFDVLSSERWDDTASGVVNFNKRIGR